jgi:hypothetical protein
MSSPQRGLTAVTRFPCTSHATPVIGFPSVSVAHTSRGSHVVPQRLFELDGDHQALLARHHRFADLSDVVRVRCQELLESLIAESHIDSLERRIGVNARGHRPRCQRNVIVFWRDGLERDREAPVATRSTTANRRIGARS